MTAFNKRALNKSASNKSVSNKSASKKRALNKRAIDEAGGEVSAFRRGDCAQSPLQGLIQGSIKDSIQGSIQGPMSQQASFGSHGYDMHPQKFVRLVGYQTSEAAKHQAALHGPPQPKAA
jgi:hypothetical protein